MAAWKAAHVAAALALLSSSASAQGEISDLATAATLRTAVAQLQRGQDLLLYGAQIVSRDLLPRVYESRDFAPLWTRADSVVQLLAAIAGAGVDGLDPENYHRAVLTTLLGEEQVMLSTETSARAAVDLLLTDALVTLGLHVRFGKVDPVSLDAAWDFLRSEQDENDAAVLAEMVPAVETGTVAAWLAENRPALAAYEPLRAELARLRTIAAQGSWPAVPHGPTLRPGDRGPRVLALRARLRVSGELGNDAEVDAATYDEAVESAVREFQWTHGLDADGVTGPRTLEALSRPPQHWIDQIRVNLERSRWVRSGFDNAVIVDIAGFDARYFRNGETVWQGRAAVGKPYRSTPVLSSRISAIVLNPTWTIPPTILREDTLPEARRDPQYLVSRGIRVIDKSGTEVDPLSVNWSVYTGGTLPYTLRQDAGPENPLGSIKFLFPNRHFVYLHDTPSRSLFARADRASSSGCIRIERPLDLAELLLAGPDPWTKDRLQKVIASGRTRTIFLPNPVPIYLLYWTAGATTDGKKIRFKNDVYGRDAAVLAALDAAPRVDERRQLSQQTP